MPRNPNKDPMTPDEVEALQQRWIARIARLEAEYDRERERADVAEAAIKRAHAVMERLDAAEHWACAAPPRPPGTGGKGRTDMWHNADLPVLPGTNWNLNQYRGAFQMAVRNFQSYGLEVEYVVMGPNVVQKLLGMDQKDAAPPELGIFSKDMTTYLGYRLLVDMAHPDYSAVFPRSQLHTLERRYQVISGPNTTPTGTSDAVMAAVERLVNHPHVPGEPKGERVQALERQYHEENLRLRGSYIVIEKLRADVRSLTIERDLARQEVAKIRQAISAFAQDVLSEPQPSSSTCGLCGRSPADCTCIPEVTK